MFDQREFIERIERSNTAEFSRLLAHPSLEEEGTLRAHLGETRYQRLHALALRGTAAAEQRGVFDWEKPAGAATAQRLGNVMLLPGIMGSELTATATARAVGSGGTIWLNLLRIAVGQLERLSLASPIPGNGFEVRASGILKSYYGEALLSLAQRWKAQAFWYDWRKSLDDAADQLRVEIDRWFGPEAPVHLVAHSMGGLVCRTFVKRHADRWKTMWDPDGGRRGGRLVMLGTPNHGSYLMLQGVCGIAATVRKIALVDQRHDLAGILSILNTFVGSFQMLPSPERDPAAEPFYNAKTYGDLSIPQGVLDAARQHHRFLRDAIDGARMVYVAGSNQPTLARLSDPTRLRDPDAYLGTTQGDGSVTHAHGLLKGVRTYFVEEEHSALMTNVKVLAALDDLLQTGKTSALSGGQVVRGAIREAALEPWREVGRAVLERQEAEFAELGQRTRQLRQRLIPALRESLTDDTFQVGEERRVNPSERVIAGLITRDLLCSDVAATSRSSTEPQRFRPSIKIRLARGPIQDVDSIPELNADPEGTGLAVDALGVGHYPGVRPQAAELALDRAISARLLNPPGGDLATSDLILTQYTERGLLRGDLGTTFFLPFPGKTDRMLAVAGMGPVGGCGGPELTILVRELCWALGRCGRHHLATVLIGSGNGNLSVRQCVESWIRGIKRALDEAHRKNDNHRLQCLTFVEFDPLKIGAIQAAILDVRQLQESEIQVEFDPLSQDQLHALEQEGLELKHERLRQQIQSQHEEFRKRRGGRFEETGGERQPTRLMVAMEEDSGSPKRWRYRFAALTESASIPEHATILNRVIIEQANDELAGESSVARQIEHGQFLGRLLIPQELRSHLSSATPLVLQLDSTTARIHWEMIAQPDPILPEEDGQTPDNLWSFLGTYRGLTRQLKSTFARPPEPARNLQLVLRVLVVADPAREAPLPGAEEEGLAVAELFELFNARAERAGWAQRFRVVRLIGPLEATPTRVLRELSTHRYDVLHFAGHCCFNPKDPTESGWVFSEGVVLSAYEMQRIDRVPPLVISNACESGITADRSNERTAALMPSFAESFFAQGVANFVGTAWPVDDQAARLFATTLYSTLIGLGSGEGVPQTSAEAAGGDRFNPLPMHLAMLRARLAVARSASGRGTWGAYQHYGNPYFRLLSAPED